VKIEAITVHVISMPLRDPFVMSFFTQTHRDHLIIEVQAEGISGWGESALLSMPFYNHETVGTGLHIVRDVIAPILLQEQPESSSELDALLQRVVGHPITRAGVEFAFWDLWAKKQGISLSKYIGATKDAIPVGVSLGMQKDPEVLLEQIRTSLAEGYQRVKLKIAPRCDLKTVELVRKHFPKCVLSVDANSSYRPAERAALLALDHFDLEMIEQPLSAGDLYEHSRLQRELRTPICLDESIESSLDAEAAIALGACKIINIKPARVGGMLETLRISKAAEAAGVLTWCGGLLETGLGTAINLAVAALPNFSLANDVTESHRYADEDIIEPEFKMTSNGMIRVPRDQPGIGVNIRRDMLARFTTHAATIRP